MSSCRELDSWTQDFVLPAVVWLSGLFNPKSFLTGELPPCDKTITYNADQKKLYILLYLSSCAAEHRSQESLAPGQDDFDCGCNKKD